MISRRDKRKGSIDLEEEIRQAAQDIINSGYIDSDDVDIDGDAKVVHPESEDSGSGYWVQAWIYVPKSALED